MRRIMWSQLYQLKKMRVMWILFIGITLILLLSVFSMQLNNEPASGSLYAGQQLPVIFIMLTILTGTVSAFVCTNDFSDQTINHEVLSGVSRNQSYFGRAAAALLVSVLSSLLELGLTVCTATVLYGWGDQFPVQTIIGEILLLTFPLIRLSAFFVMIAFILKRPFAVIGVSCAMIYAIMQAGGTGLFHARNYFLSGIANAVYILHTEQFGVFAAGSKDINYVLLPTVTPGSAAVTAAASLLAAAGWLLLGCSYFRHDDLK